MTLVQSKGSAAVTSLTFNSATTTGNKIIVTVCKWASNVATTDVTDNKGNTYTQRAVNNSVSPKAAIFESQDSPTMGASHQINLVGAADSVINIYEVSGLTSAPFDKQANSAGASGATADTTATATLAQANEEVFAVLCSDQGAGALTESAGQNWTTVIEQENGVSFLCYSSLHKTVSSTAAVQATWTRGDTLSFWSACIATFKLSGGTDWPVNPVDSLGLTDTALALTQEWRLTVEHQIKVGP